MTRNPNVAEPFRSMLSAMSPHVPETPAPKPLADPSAASAKTALRALTEPKPVTYARLDAALAGHDVLAIIGPMHPAEKKAFERAVRAGKLAKWRGRWFPTPGAPWGIGPLKTCYGTPAWRDHFASFRSAS